MDELLTMSAKELNRLEVMGQVDSVKWDGSPFAIGRINAYRGSRFSTKKEI